MKLKKLGRICNLHILTIMFVVKLIFSLVCDVSYQNGAGVLKNFRKFFKIQVLKPLDVKTKFYNAENDDVYLEAQVQNITSGPICLEKVALDASHVFNGKLFNRVFIFLIFFFEQ